MANLLDTTPDQLKGFLPKNRRFVPGECFEETLSVEIINIFCFPTGDWRAYNKYVDGLTGTVLRSGTIVPLFNGGFVPANGRPKVKKDLLIKLEGDLESRQLHAGYTLKEEDRDGCFPRAFRRIDQCQPGDVVYLTVYVFQSDLASWMMAKKLVEAKKRGCDVQVIYDAAGSSISDLVTETSTFGRKSVKNGATSDQIYQFMRNAGIPVIKYPIGKAKSQLNHRKMLLVGGGPNSNIPATGFVFINVGTEYFAIWDDFGWMVEGL